MIGLVEGEGTSCCDLKVRQYVCSGVKGEGPGGSLTGWRGSTGADIFTFAPCQGVRRSKNSMKAKQQNLFFRVESPVLTVEIKSLAHSGIRLRWPSTTSLLVLCVVVHSYHMAVINFYRYGNSSYLRPILSSAASTSPVQVAKCMETAASTVRSSTID